MTITREQKPFRLFVSTGDVSGDLQAALLVDSLQAHLEAQGRQLSVAGLGGERLAQAGAQVFEVPPKLSVVGWWMGLLHIPAGLGLLRRAKLALAAADFDAAVLVDFSGFNVPLARYIRRNYDFPVFYYIPPQDWIWTIKGNRLLHRPFDMQEAVDWVLPVHPREAEY
ncbi:MAG: lipid-A-disaccharide synthase, partial [bacterium]|nr:lipid-A-disaccharide synthase [bacterium]